MNAGFPKSARLRKRRDYLRVGYAAKRMTGHWMIVEACSSKFPMTRLGITVTKRFGKAHDRNRFKRIVREAFRLSRQEIPNGLDIIIKPRTAALKAHTQDIVSELINILGFGQNLSAIHPEPASGV